MTRLCFLIRQLNDGGAQRQLLELVKRMDKSKFDITVITFYDGGRFSEEIKKYPDIKYISLKKCGRWDIIGFLARLIKVLRKKHPEILHGYLGTSNILTIMLKLIMPSTRMVWGVRSAYMDLEQYDWLARLSYWFECRVSRFADLIIVNSYTGFEYAAAHGFPREKMIIVPNGIDTKRFFPDSESRKRIRKEWQLADDEKLIGIVGRLDPMKDYPTFLKAAALLLKERQDLRFVCVGDGPVDYRQELQILGKELGLDKHLIWAGARGDMPAVYNAFDIFTLSSYGEGFPNVIGEAMACDIPCVVTDVGDSAQIIGDIGIVVCPQNPLELTNGWRVMLKHLNHQNHSINKKSHEYVMQHFGLDKLVHKTSEALVNLL